MSTKGLTAAARVVVDGVTAMQEHALEYSFASAHGLAYAGMDVGAESRLARPLTVEVTVTVNGGGVTVAAKKRDCWRVS